MRLCLVIGIASLPIVLPACFSSTSVDDAPVEDQPDSGGPDAAAGTDAAMMDATMTMVQSTMEAAVAETSTPTPEAAVDAGPLAVTVVVVNDLGPEPGATVVFQDATGHVLATVTTDASGRASQVVEAGSQVTAVLGTPENVELVTVEGVTPGDTITAHDATAATFANAQVSIDALPDAAPPPGTDSYLVNVGNCYAAFESTPMLLPLTLDCENGGTFPVLVEALNSDDPNPLGFTYQNGNTLPLDGGIAHVSLNGAWSTVSPTQSISLANVPSALTTYTSYGEIANGVALGQPSYVTPDGDGGATGTFPVHPGYAASAQSEANVSSYRNSGVAVSAVATRTPPSDGGSSSFDLSTLLPLIDDVTLDSSQPGRPTVTWVTEAGSLAAASGTLAVLTWTAPDDASGIFGTWMILAPPTATSVQAPELPASLAAWAPSADATFSSPASVIVVQGSFLSSYAQLRSLFSTLPVTNALLSDNLSQGPVVPPLPVDGTLRLTAFTANGD